MTTLVILFVLGLAPRQETPQEKPRVPKDSIELVLTGCLKGRVLAVSAVRRTDVESGPDIRARSFRLAGKRDVMDSVKREDHHLVDVTGIVKRSALYQEGMKVGKGITISGGRPVAGSGAMAAPDPSQMVPVMDVESIRLRATSCGGEL
jgi:hypothetical protein